MVIFDFSIYYGFVVGDCFSSWADVFKNKKYITFKVGSIGLVGDHRLILILIEHHHVLLGEDDVNFFMLGFFVFVYWVSLKNFIFDVVYLYIFDGF